MKRVDRLRNLIRRRKALVRYRVVIDPMEAPAAPGSRDSVPGMPAGTDDRDRSPQPDSGAQGAR